MQADVKTLICKNCTTSWSFPTVFVIFETAYPMANPFHNIT